MLLGKVWRWFPVAFLPVFLGRHHHQRRCPSPVLLLSCFAYTGENSVVHPTLCFHKGTTCRRMCVVGSWKTEAFRDACSPISTHLLIPPFIFNSFYDNVIVFNTSLRPHFVTVRAFTAYRQHNPILYPITDIRAVCVVPLAGSILMNIHEHWLQ